MKKNGTLALSREIGETIVIGGNIMVTVVQVSGTKVRLAIQAPPEVTVNRLEIEIAKKGAVK